MKYDHILIVGFGAPERPEDIRPFLKEVTGGRDIPEQRIQAVADQYLEIGGSSPYHDNVQQIKINLHEALSANQIDLPVYIGYRCWHPFLKDTFADIKRKNLKSGAVVILAPFRSLSSCKRYKDAVREYAVPLDLSYTYTQPWGTHPLVIEAVCEETVKKLSTLTSDEIKHTQVLFSCHSIPLEMIEACPYCNYEEELSLAAKLVAEKCSLSSWGVVYHSRSGNPKQPWLGPDINEHIHALDRNKFNRILVVSLGFVCENAEILYDLDILAKNAALSNHLKYLRADTIFKNTKFTAMLSEILQDVIAPQ